MRATFWTLTLDWITARIKNQKPFLFLIFVILTLGLVWIFLFALFVELQEPQKPFDSARNRSGIIVYGKEARSKKKMAATTATTTTSFDVRTLVRAFEDCLATPGLDLTAFLAGYRQLCFFMVQVIGKAVSMAVKELEIHVSAVEELRSNSNEDDHYDTIKSMIDFEYQEHVTKGTPYKGAIPCLYLHRTTSFVVSFLHLLFSSSSSSTSSSAIVAYDSTVGKRHSWIIQKTAHFASHLLPAKEAFLAALKTDGNLDLAKTLIKNGQEIFEITQKFYDEKHLLEIAP